jgi:uncharacterized protein (DUF849 family)
LIIQACLNGARPASYHVDLPQAAADVVRDVRECLRTGANEFHIHVYGEVDRESLDPADVDEVIGAVRAVAPGTLIGISTGDWIENDDQRRLACIAAWNMLPDHASVNLSEPGAPEVIRALHERGIGIEAGLSGPADAEQLIASGLAPLVLRMLVEVDAPTVNLAMTQADETIRALARLPSPKPILLHGFDDTTWPFVERAFRSGYSVRIGLEDTNLLPDGSVAESNAELVRAAFGFRDRLSTR